MTQPRRPAQPTRAPRNNVGSVALGLALVALLASRSQPGFGIAFATLALLFSVVAIVIAVRTDYGVGRSLSAFLVGLLALALAAFSAGGDRMFG